MSSANNVAIIHSHYITDDGKPMPEYRARLSEWLQLITSETVGTIILGWWKPKWWGIRYCDAGSLWLQEQWASKSTLKVEEDISWSLDSVWEMLFARRDHSQLLQAANTIHIVSSNYHVGRLWEIASFILWEELKKKIQMIWVPVLEPRTLEQEQASLNAFRTTFAGVSIWDLAAIEARMWQQHGLYRDHPSNPSRTQEG